MAGGAVPNPARSRSYIPHPSEYAAAAEGPFWGAVAGILGGAILSIYGSFAAAYGPTSSLLSWFLVGSGISSTAAGILMFMTGIVVAFVAWMAFHAPEHHRAYGASIWILLFFLGLLVTGWGFYFASFLAGVGAAHVFWWKPNRVGGVDLIRRVFQASDRFGKEPPVILESSRAAAPREPAPGFVVRVRAVAARAAAGR